jgi:glycogen phosphorylase
MSRAEPIVQTPSWWDRRHGGEDGFLVAYFCMEFGLDESLPLYSGGLGVLAGDHLKAASELGLPLVGVGPLYRDGYFRQRLDEAGRQAEAAQPVDPEALGLVRETTVEVELAGETVEATVWRHDVGRVALYLLDAPGLTDGLYAGDREHRIRQELLVGVGGVRALTALGLEPTVFHMNEGHAAFLALERVRALVEGGAARDEALERVRATTVFTTHTPVPAGNEVFEPELVARFAGELAARCGFEEHELLALGRSDGDDRFGMTPLALRLSASANAVSELHGEVAREMWAGIDTPIGHVTNGVHPGTWIAPELDELMRDAGVRPEAELWEGLGELDPAAIQRVHEQRKGSMAEATGLDRGRLTIGLARRFATYKRAGLLFGDLDRLLALPVQIVVAGKAHPADDGGKDLMQWIVNLSRDSRCAGRVVFVEDYDMGVARLLVQGCDVWLNTPRRPQEASGTSGMKAAMNGVLNLSVLDGWWPEAYAPDVGWAIPGTDDEADAAELYRLLEEEVVPAYEDRERWAGMMKASIERLTPRFAMHRAVREYVEGYYLSAHHAARSSS